MDDRVQRGTSNTARRELNRRRAGGLEVVLYWYGDADNVSVSVSDATTGADFELEVESANALDAFWHPYAYASALLAGRL
ncbi:MAG: hypothetical protein WBB74_08590 [Gaiellaceae bacterium]